MDTFSIAGIQMHLSAHQDNIPSMRHKLNTLMAIYPWVEMVIFSELAPFGPLSAKAQKLPGPTDAIFGEMAAKHRIWLLPGSIFELADDDKIYNTSTVYNPEGAVVGRYRKMFPFRPYEMDVASGSHPLAFDVPSVGRFGVSICYDMWFPETTRTLAAMGAEVILHPTMTTTIDREIELAITRANAAMNQVYFFDINGLGDCGLGRSIVCGPEGYVMHQSGSSEEMIPIEIDLGRLRRTREKGLRGLGQPLKSFRDRTVDFRVYHSPSEFPYLNTLGTLEKSKRKEPFMLGHQEAQQYVNTEFKVPTIPETEAHVLVDNGLEDGTSGAAPAPGEQTKIEGKTVVDENGEKLEQSTPKNKTESGSNDNKEKKKWWKL